MVYLDSENSILYFSASQFKIAYYLPFSQQVNGKDSPDSAYYLVSWANYCYREKCRCFKDGIRYVQRVNLIIATNMRGIIVGISHVLDKVVTKSEYPWHHLLYTPNCDR